MTMESIKVALCLELTVPAEQIEQGVGYSPFLLGDLLAEQVAFYVEENGLSYFPAFENFIDLPEVDQDLMLLIQELAQYAAFYTTEQLKRLLRGAFSSLNILDVRSTIYAMPKVRCQQTDAIESLAQHFTPDTVKLNLQADWKLPDGVLDPVNILKNELIQAVTEEFSNISIINARLLQGCQLVKSLQKM